MSEWIACLDKTSIKLEHNTNAKTPEILMFTQERYGSTVVRMTREMAEQLANELKEMSEEQS